ncbi:MAG: YggT family protein [Solirubrobacteraceae bacterium]
MILGSVRTEIAGYLSTLIYVYILLIFAHIVLGWVFASGMRVPYSRTSSAVIGFLRDVCEPFLRLFRRMIPMAGGFDFSPVIAIIVLEIVNRVIVNDLIHG